MNFDTAVRIIFVKNYLPYHNRGFYNKHEGVFKNMENLKFSKIIL